MIRMSLNLDSELLQVLVILDVVRNGLLDDLCALLAVLLDPLGVELLVGLLGFLLQ